MMRALSFSIAILLLAQPAARAQTAPATTSAATPEQLLQRGLRSYAVGQYDEAIASFRRGYELAPRAEFLYALAQAQRMQGDCRAAAASYRAYLRTAPPERSAAPARENLKRCEAQLAAAPPPAPNLPAANNGAPATGNETSAGGTTIANEAATSAAASGERRRWWRDPAGDALGGLGLAALAAGGSLWGVGEAGARSLADATQYGQFAAHAAQADSFDRERTAGIVTVAAGGALTVAAIIRWSLVARHRR